MPSTADGIMPMIRYFSRHTVCSPPRVGIAGAIVPNRGGFLRIIYQAVTAAALWERSHIDVTVATDYKRVQMRECSIHLLLGIDPESVVRDRASRRSVATGMPVSGGEKP